MKRSVLTGAGALVIAAVVGTSGASAMPAAGDREQPADETYVCKNALGQPTGDTISFTGTKVAWPPNHKYKDANFTATNGGLDQSTTLDTEGTHDQYVEGTEQNGAGNTANDVSPAADMDSGTGSASTHHQFRAERSGHKWEDEDQWRGRTYTFTATATFDTVRECTTTFTATVPHDQGNHNGSSKSSSRKLTRSTRAARRAR